MRLSSKIDDFLYESKKQGKNLHYQMRCDSSATNADYLIFTNNNSPNLFAITTWLDEPNATYRYNIIATDLSIVPLIEPIVQAYCDERTKPHKEWLKNNQK